MSVVSGPQLIAGNPDMAKYPLHKVKSISNLDYSQIPDYEPQASTTVDTLPPSLEKKQLDEKNEKSDKKEESKSFKKKSSVEERKTAEKKSSGSKEQEKRIQI